MHRPPARLHPEAIVVLLLSVALPACVSGGEDAETPAAPSADDRIEMSRGPCFGTCPVYTVTVHGDGRVRYVGERFVAKTGERSATVPPADVAALFAYADSIGYFGLPGDITPANPSACSTDGIWTDMPSAELIVERGDRAHTVQHYHGCPRAPESLTRLEERIDSVARVGRWVGQP